MSKMQVAKAMMSVEMAEMMVKMEPASVKKRIICQAIVFGLCSVILTGFYWARIDSIANY